MVPNNPVGLPLLLAVLSALVVGIKWHATPHKLPIWWNLEASPIAWVPRWFGLLLFPVLQLLIPYVLYQLASRDHFLEGQSGESANALANVIVLPAVFLFAVHHLVYMEAALSADHAFSPRILAANIALWLLIWLGYNFQYIEPNSTIGVAAFWTASYKSLWKEVHERAAWALMSCGGLLLILSMVIPTGVPLLVATLVLWLGAYVAVCVDDCLLVGRHDPQSLETGEPLLPQE